MRTDENISQNFIQNNDKPKSQKFTGLLFKIAGLLLGFGILYYVIQNYGGLEKISFYLKKTGWGYVWVILNSFVGIVLYTLAWKQFLPKADHPLRFLSLLKVKLCGEGINFMTPLGFIAGDPIRAALLQKYLGPQSQMRSVVVDRVMHTLAAHLINFLGLILLFTTSIDFPATYSWALVLFYGITSLMIAKFTVSLLSGSGFGKLDKFFYKIGLPKRFPKIHAKIEELKTDLTYYKDKPKWPFWQSFFLHFGGRVLGIVEIALVLWCIEGRWEWTFSAMLTAITSFVTVACSFIPGALGPLESLYAYFFSIYGLSPQIGISIQLIRRLRTFFWIGIGILLLDYKHISEKFFTKKPAR